MSEGNLNDSDYDQWLNLWKFAQENKLPKGEYCLWGRECPERERNNTHEGRHVFYLNDKGFSISRSVSDYHGEENFSVEFKQDYGSDVYRVSYDFGFDASFLTLKPGQNTHELVQAFNDRLAKIHPHNLIPAMRGDFEFYLENRERREQEELQREIDAKQRELAKLLVRADDQPKP